MLPLSSRLSMPLTESLMSKLGSSHGARLMDDSRFQAVQGGQAAENVDFISMIGQSVAEVNSMQNQSTQAVHEMLTGGDVQPAEVFASVQKADMAFRMLLQVRNKLMQAYEEVNAIRI